MDNFSNGATTMSVNDVTRLVMNTGQMFHSLSVVENERDKLKAQCTTYRNKLKNAHRLMIKVKEENSGEILEKTKQELNHYINLYHTSKQETAVAQGECKKVEERLLKEQKKNQKPTSRSNKDKLCHQYQDKILELELEVDEWKSKHDEVSQRLNQQNVESKVSVVVKREDYQNVTEELKSLRTNYSLLIGDNKRLKERDKTLEEKVENLKLKNRELKQRIKLHSKSIENLHSPRSTTTSSSYIGEPQNLSLGLDLIDTLEDEKVGSQQNLDIFGLAKNTKELQVSNEISLTSKGLKTLDSSLGLDLIDTLEDQNVRSQQNLNILDMGLINENTKELQTSDEISLTSKGLKTLNFSFESECEEDDITQEQVRQILDEMIYNRPTCLSPIPPSPPRTLKKIQSHQNGFTKLEMKEEYRKLVFLIENERQKLNTMSLDVIATEKELKTAIEEERKKLAQVKEENNRFDDVLTQQQTKLNGIKVDITNAQNKFNQIIENQTRNCAKIEKLENEQKKFNLAKLDVIEAQKKINEMVEELKSLKEENGKLKVTLKEVLVKNDESFSKTNKAHGLTVQETKILAQKIARKEIRTHLIKKNAIMKAKLKKERNMLIRIGFKRGRRSRSRLGSGMNDPILDGHCGQRSVDSGYIISDSECDSFEIEQEEIVNSNISVDAQLPMSCASNKTDDDIMTLFDVAPVDSTISSDNIETLKSEVTESRTKNCETNVISTKSLQNSVSDVGKEEPKSNIATNQINIMSYYIALPSSPAKKTLPVEVGNVKNTPNNRSFEDYFSLNDDSVRNTPITTKLSEKTIQELQDLLEDDLNLSESDCDVSPPEKEIENAKDLKQKIDEPRQSLECALQPLQAAIQNKVSPHSLFDLTDESDGNDLLMVDGDCLLENDDSNTPETTNKNSQDAPEKIMPITTMLARNVVQESKLAQESLNEIQKDVFSKNEINVKRLPENNFDLKDERNAAISTRLSNGCGSKNDDINSSTAKTEKHVLNKSCLKAMLELQTEAPKRIDTRTSIVTKLSEKDVQNQSKAENVESLFGNISDDLAQESLNEIQKDVFSKNEINVKTLNRLPENNFDLKDERNASISTRFSNACGSKNDNINSSTAKTEKHVLNKNCPKAMLGLQTEAPKRIDTRTSIVTKLSEKDVQNQSKAENVESLFGNISDDSDVPLVIANKRPLIDDFYLSNDSDSESSAMNKSMVDQVFTDDSDNSDVPLSNLQKTATKSTKESLPKKKLDPSKRKRFLRDQISSARNKFVLAIESDNEVVDNSESLSCKGAALPIFSSDSEGPVSLPIYRVEAADSAVSRVKKKRKITNDKKEIAVKLSDFEHSPRRSPRNLSINNAVLNKLKGQSQQQEERATYKRPNCWANQKKASPVKKIEERLISVKVDLIGFKKNGEMVLSSSELEPKSKKKLWEETHKLLSKLENKTKVPENKWIDLPFLPLISPKIKNEDTLYNESTMSPKPDIKNEDFVFSKIPLFQNQSEFRNNWPVKDEKKPELFNFIPQTFKSEDFPFKVKEENHDINQPSTSRKVPTNYMLIEKAVLMLFEVPSNSMINILLSNYEIKPLCRVIVKMSTEDFECIPVKRNNPIAPILSEYQIVLLRLLIAMTRKDDNTRRIFLKIAERAILSINNPINLEPVARLHVAYMKYFHQFVHAKSFIFCSLVNMGNLAVPYLYFLASSWSEVFVKYQDASENDRLLIRAIISVLKNKELPEPEYYKLALINFLVQIHQFPSDVLPVGHMLKEIINEYFERRCDKVKIMILIIGRNLGGVIFYKQFVSNLKLVQFKSEAHIDVAFDLFNFLICNIFEINDPTVMMIREWLSGLLPSCHSENTKKKLIMIRSKIDALS